MIGVQQGIVKIVVLIGELDGGLFEHDALLHAVAGGEVAGGDVADDDFQGHDRDFLHQGLPLAQLLDEVSGDTGLLHLGHQAVGHLVVDDALAHDGALLQTVQGGGVVLVVHDDQIGVIRLKDLLGLALINLL